MRKSTLLIAILFTAVGITIGFSINATAQEPPIPSWIKDTARWWADGQVSDADFIKALQWLINQGILQVPQSSQSQQTVSTPSGGPLVTVDGLQYSVNSTKVYKENDFMAMPAVPGGSYIDIRLEVTNVINYPQDLNNTITFTLVDSKGRNYNARIMNNENSDVFGDLLIEPGMTGWSNVIFLVPAGTQLDYTLLIQGTALEVGTHKT